MSTIIEILEANREKAVVVVHFADGKIDHAILGEVGTGALTQASYLALDWSTQTGVVKATVWFDRSLVSRFADGKFDGPR